VNNGIYLGGGLANCLPSFVTSYLLPPMDYSYINTCLGDTVSFVLSDSVSSVLWDFGDTASINNGSTLLNATHHYAVPGTYTVSAACLHYGMHDTVVQTINIYTRPVVNLGRDTLIDSNTVLILDAGAGFASYLWSNGATTSSISIVGASMSPGAYDYSVIATDSNGCSATDSVKVYKNSTSPGFEEMTKKLRVLIYPNPTDQTFHIAMRAQFKTAQLSLYNMQGQLLMQKQITQKEFDLDVSALSEGIYQLRINTDVSTDTYSLSIVR
jgi:PKD repeat protein